MAHTTGETLSDLERRAEATRAELAQTVDELHSRVSPEAIKSDMRSYARGRGQQMLGLIEERARDNPLQAMAVAAGLAYPLWRLLGRMPAPVLLLGAGAVLAYRRDAGGMARRDDAAPEPGAGGHSDFGGFPEAEPGVIDHLKTTASGISSRIAATAVETLDTVKQAASAQVNRAAGMISDGYEMSRERAAEAAGLLGETYERTRGSLVAAIERHPFVAGGVGLAAGSLLASALPRTAPEDRLLGEAADEVKRQSAGLARQTARTAFDAAADAAQGAAGNPDRNGEQA